MVLRIILGIFPGCGASELQDAPGWQDYPGDFPGCCASELQDARGCPRMVP